MQKFHCHSCANIIQTLAMISTSCFIESNIEQHVIQIIRVAGCLRWFGDLRSSINLMRGVTLL